jgi:serine phosphatase RsbU (regulator of sigma subunit)
MLDQLANENTAPFGKKSFYTLIKQLTNEPMEQQKQLILKAYYQYRGEHDQLDDMTVIGFKIKVDK